MSLHRHFFACILRVQEEIEGRGETYVQKIWNNSTVAHCLGGIFGTWGEKGLMSSFS